MDSPAQRVVRLFGGQSALARLIGKNQSTVQHWVSTGAIPAKWHGPLMAFARENDIGLRAEDFLPRPEPASPDGRRIEFPVAKWQGELSLGGNSGLPCFVLDDGRRVISRTAATSALTGLNNQGSLETYIRVEALQGYVPDNLDELMIDFIIAQVKHKLFLEEEMRPWEKTFPDDLWREFGRLTNWKGTIHQRPKYWGHLVNELVYGYLDADVAQWL